MVEWHLGLSADVPFPEIRSLALELERLGADGVWLTDVRFTRDCYTLLGALAEATTTLRLASGVSDPFSRHPAQLASAIATVHEISGGRAILGLGSGGSKLENIGVKRVRPLATVEAAFGAIRGLLAGERVDADAPGFHLADGQLALVDPRPVPLALVAHGPKMYRLAGKVADIALVANYATAEGIGWARSRIEEGAADRDAPPKLLWRVDACLSRGGDEARATMREHVRRPLASGYYSPAFLEPLGLAELTAATDWSQAELDRVVDAVALAGDPTQVGARIASILQLGLIDGICCRLETVPGEDRAGSLALLHEALTAASG